MKLPEREKIYDDILIYLRDNKGGRSIEGIMQNTNSFYKDRNDIIRELVEIGYVSKTNHEMNGDFYSLSPQGKTFIRSSSFVKAMCKQRNDKIISIILKISASVGGIVAAIYYGIQIWNNYHGLNSG